MAMPSNAESFERIHARSVVENAADRTQTTMPASLAGVHWAAAESATIQGEKKPEPFIVRRTGPRVGRNDPCSCGSGKKSKKCCRGRS